MEVPPIDVIISITADQSIKLFKREQSIFSPGIWPFGPNLLIKNLSWEEIETIYNHVPSTKYPAVLRHYYTTYKFSNVITNDNERNSKRHSFWIISMMKDLGEKNTREIANAHERGRPGSAKDNAIDALNNEAAIKYAKENPNVHPADGAYDMWIRGLLVDNSYQGCKDKQI